MRERFQILLQMVGMIRKEVELLQECQTYAKRCFEPSKTTFL